MEKTTIRTFIFIFALFHSALGFAQDTWIDQEKDITPVVSLVNSTVNHFVKAMTYFLSPEYRSYMEGIGYEGGMKHLENTESLMAFMCFDDDDKTHAKDASGRNINILPYITINMINITSGKTLVVKKNIRNLYKFYKNVKYELDHIEVNNVQVYCINMARKIKGADIGYYTYYKEHVYSIESYKVDKDNYELVNKQDVDFSINRGKSYWDSNRDEEKLFKKDGVVVILGDISINVYYK